MNVESKYLNKVITMHNGLNATLIKYNNYKNVIVRFDDGLEKRTSITSFVNGTVKHPNFKSFDSHKKGKSKYLGETRIMHNGLKATLIEYKSENDIIVKFEDGSIVHSSFSNFYTGRVANPNVNAIALDYKNKYLNTQKINNSGEVMTIVDYVKNTKIKIRFEDGTEVFTEMKSFKKGLVKNPNRLKNQRVNETKFQKCGMNATVTDYINGKNVKIKFEDGTIVENQTYHNFISGKIPHPERPMGAVTTLLKNGIKVRGAAYILKDGKPQMNVTLPNGNRDVMSWEEIYAY